MNIDQALMDPAQMFDEPGDVLEEASLSREDKIKILRRWEFDAREREVAEEENMAGAQDSRLGDILAALNQLGAHEDHGHSPPTKQGGE
ncbi:hypothetical protein KQ940_15340 [Marinobacterium sp. D7]|uniref:hypothetical protein n=1 Tax=Marinobacterium ramblicola TaxID=2849041 RepID=UPI001C2D3D1D|nr:hypothetical protein [Marinobacterium ramblicola]MBV1789429.1 hypothetical protein [Marinobacterium ramblicola]